MDQRVARARSLLISEVLYFKGDADCATGAKTRRFYKVNSRIVSSDMTLDILGHALSCIQFLSHYLEVNFFKSVTSRLGEIL
jgi:hypothetical protein